MMSTWWFFSGLIPVAIGFVAFLYRFFPRRLPTHCSCFMTRAEDGTPIQFIVTSTRKIEGSLSTSLRERLTSWFPPGQCTFSAGRIRRDEAAHAVATDVAEASNL